MKKKENGAKLLNPLMIPILNNWIPLKSQNINKKNLKKTKQKNRADLTP